MTEGILGSISSTFQEQLLPTQTPKAQKKTDNLTVFFALSESALVKAICRTLMKLTPEVVPRAKVSVKDDESQAADKFNRPRPKKQNSNLFHCSQ